MGDWHALFDNLLTVASLSSWQIKKPIIERKRRERINDSLNQLKALVLDALNKDVSTGTSIVVQR